MKSIHLWLIFSLLSTGSFTTVRADSGWLKSHNPELDKSRQHWQNLIHEQKLAGVSVGVVDSSGLIWQFNAGYANRQKNIPTSAKTLYRVGSLTKLLTAAAILQLEQDGYIDIDQAASAYIPRFSYKTRFTDPGVITPRTLMTHLSGLPSNLNKGLWTEERFTDLVERLRIEYAAYPVDFITNYSNIGYSLLGVILEQSSPYLYEEYLQKHLLQPLEMNNSGFEPYGASGPLAATGYRQLQAQEHLPMRDIPAMGLNSSVEELSHFMQMLLNRGEYQDRQILDPDQVAEMFRVQNQNVQLDLDRQTGIAWTLERSGPDRVLLAEHSGTTLNFSSYMVLAPEKKIGVVILTNSAQANRPLRSIAQRLINHLIDNHPQPAVPAVPNRIASPASTPDHADRARFISKTGILELDQTFARLCECQSQKKVNLIPLPDGWFGLSPDQQHMQGKIRQQKIDDREVIVLEKDGKQQRVGARFDPAPNRFNWEQRFGEYEVINPDKNFPVTDVRIFDEDGMTFICYRMPKLSEKLVVLPITPVSETEAISEGLGRSKGETIYSRRIDGEDLLIYSGYIARRKSN